jgi:hypothetical protein
LSVPSIRTHGNRSPPWTCPAAPALSEPTTVVEGNLRNGAEDEFANRLECDSFRKDRRREARSHNVGNSAHDEPFAKRLSTDAQRLLDASRTTAHLRTAILLWAFPDRGWWLPYRVVEDIEMHLGTSVAKAGYCTRKERERFRHSANSAKASGLGARHAVGKQDPPKNPMSLDQATTLVKGLLESALRDSRGLPRSDQVTPPG